MNKITRAISIRQPYVEQILRGTKKREYRSRPTTINEQVWLYAAKTPGLQKEWRNIGLSPGDLPTGMIVGTVEITGCEYNPRTGNYEYLLRGPIRLKRYLRVRNQPQPCFWRPKFY